MPRTVNNSLCILREKLSQYRGKYDSCTGDIDALEREKEVIETCLYIATRQLREVDTNLRQLSNDDQLYRYTIEDIVDSNPFLFRTLILGEGNTEEEDEVEEEEEEEDDEEEEEEEQNHNEESKYDEEKDEEDSIQDKEEDSEGKDGEGENVIAYLKNTRKGKDKDEAKKKKKKEKKKVFTKNEGGKKDKVQNEKDPFKYQFPIMLPKKESPEDEEIQNEYEDNNRYSRQDYEQGMPNDYQAYR